MRRAARKDDNHQQIVEAFRSLGWSVLDIAQLKNCCDLFVAKGGHTYAIEIKDGTKPPSARKLTKGELEFLCSWDGHWRIIESIENVVKLNEEIR